MTAEIAVINKTAVALAADSKVTLSKGGKQKTYDTVDKLFSISKTEPVGAMIYGNAEFMRFPWETILKEYRRRDPRKKFDTIFLWADDLFRFLLTFFPFTDDDEDVAALSIVEAWLQNYWESCARASEGPDQFKANYIAEIKAAVEELSLMDNFLTDEEWSNLHERLSPKLDIILKRGFLSQLGDILEDLRSFAALVIRKAYPSPGASGLVIAGFGEKELLPSLQAFRIDGILCKRIKSFETDNFDATRENRGGVMPFAQTDMVDRFMQGIDPEYAVQLHESIKGLLYTNAVDTALALGHSQDDVDSKRDAFTTATGAAVDKFWESHQRIRRERFVSPIVDMAMSLPKDELANLAESLVSLTSLQRRVSRELETVGGAIDVAVISKGDGFVWIKRKHYFKPDRNLRFVNSYFAEYGVGSNGGMVDEHAAAATD
ncbi:hypothetical protein NKJ23_10775 [Mesorhizobium sp. M0184]|uniref:hypothetical protein n=1 Tax=Mesorhizobium sp. M0184 TaxID=2956906 RepID=UPI00333D6D3F